MRLTLVVSEGLQVADNLAIPSHLVRRAVLARAGPVRAPKVDDVGAGAEAGRSGKRVGREGGRARAGAAVAAALRLRPVVLGRGEVALGRVEPAPVRRLLGVREPDVPLADHVRAVCVGSTCWGQRRERRGRRGCGGRPSATHSRPASSCGAWPSLPPTPAVSPRRETRAAGRTGGALSFGALRSTAESDRITWLTWYGRRPVMMDERVGAQYQNWYDRSSLRAAAVRERSASATRPAAEQRREGSARHALGDQLVGVWGNHVRIVPAHVVPAQVVHHHLVHSSCSAGREDRSAGAERARGGGASERSAEEQKPMARSP